MKIRYVAFFIAGLSLACSTAFSQTPSDAEIRKMLADRLGQQDLGVGIVVGITSRLLMDMTRRGEVAVTDPVAKFLPAKVKVPERNKRKITLADLSTQSSGLAANVGYTETPLAQARPISSCADATVEFEGAKQ